MRITGISETVPYRKLKPDSDRGRDLKSLLHYSYARKALDLRDRNMFTLLRKSAWPALALSAAMFFLNAGTRVLAYGSQSNADSTRKTSNTYIDEEEDKAYQAAKREPDSKKRAEKLYEFYRKYPESVLLRQADYKEIELIIAAHTDYYAASQEPDVEKRATLLIEFYRKYPDSNLIQYIEPDYMRILEELWERKKYELLGSLSGKWLQLHPNNREAYAYIAKAAVNLNQFERCGESLEAIYEIEPSPSLAKEIHNCYQRTDNIAKRIEWADILFELPDFDSDYMLRFDCMIKFYEEMNLPQAAEYANLTLKSARLAEQMDGKIHDELQKLRRVCYHIIASDFFEKGEYDGAITFFKEAVQAEQYGQGYYKIGLCLDHQKKIDDAMQYYAMAELLDDGSAPEAKSRLEILYKALHNQTLIGIEKVYKKARELLGETP